MKKIIAIVLAFVLLLSFTGCENVDNKENDTPKSNDDTPSETTESVRYEVPVDWSDFIKIDGVIYTGDWRKTEVLPDKIGAKIGEVSCGVPKVYADGDGNIQNSNPENGASYLCKIGTELFFVIDSDTAIAALVDGKYYLYTVD